jgi:hypothetical protein
MQQRFSAADGNDKRTKVFNFFCDKMYMIEAETVVVRVGFFPEVTDATSEIALIEDLNIQMQHVLPVQGQEGPQLFRNIMMQGHGIFS